MEIIYVPKGTKVYRSFTDNIKREGYWFSLNETDTYGYGSYTGEFTASKDLKLINITNSDFYNILKQLLKESTATNNSLRTDYHNILFPLGFDDVLFYRELAKLYGIDPNLFALNPMVHSESIINFNNRSRLSIHQLDSKFMKFLKLVLSSVSDGIISLKPFPDIIRNGMQPPELSVYDKSFFQYIQDKPRTVVGGGNSLYLPPLRLDNEQIKKAETGIDNMLNYIDTNNIKIDLSKITFTTIPLKEALKMNLFSSQHVKLAKKTRKLRRNYKL